MTAQSRLKHVIWNGITGSPSSHSNPAKLNHSVSSANPRLQRAIYSLAEARPGAGVELQILFMAFFWSARRFVSSCVTKLQLLCCCFLNVSQDRFHSIGRGSIGGFLPFSPCCSCLVSKESAPFERISRLFHACVAIRCVRLHAFHLTWRKSSAGLPTNCLRRTSRSACGWAVACSGRALHWVQRYRCCSYWVSC